MADKEIAFRQPPGDRWKLEGSDLLFTSLPLGESQLIIKIVQLLF